uniref:Putative secreted protein n=1 Tax=Anopheles darlingi TaxID=43151 RepID=A0A2M4DCU8_ANODA
MNFSARTWAKSSPSTHAPGILVILIFLVTLQRALQLIRITRFSTTQIFFFFYNSRAERANAGWAGETGQRVQDRITLPKVWLPFVLFLKVNTEWLEHIYSTMDSVTFPLHRHLSKLCCGHETCSTFYSEKPPFF